jgi:hypothetical protein
VLQSLDISLSFVNSEKLECNPHYFAAVESSRTGVNRRQYSTWYLQCSFLNFPGCQDCLLHGIHSKVNLLLFPEQPCELKPIGCKPSE